MIDPNAMPQASGGIAGAMPQSMPQEAPAFEQKGRSSPIGGDLLKALAAQKLLRDKQMAENQLAMSQEADANTVVAKNEAELSKRSLAEVSKGVSDVLTKKNVDKQKNMQRMAQGPRGRPPQGAAMQVRPPQGAATQVRPPQGAATRTAGIANNPRPNMAMMAQGGIVGFAEGQTVDAKIAAIKNSTTMSEEQKNAAIKQLYATEAEGQAEGLKGTRNFLNQNLNPDMLAGDAIGLGEKLVGGGANLLASGANLANMPGIGAALSRFGDKRSKVGQKYIDQGFYGGITNAGFDAPNEEVAAPVTTAPEGPAFEQTGRGTPPVVPSVAPAPAVASTEGLPTYNDKMRNIERALGARGLGGYSAAIQQIEDNEVAQETASRKVDVNEQVAKSTSRYQDMIVAERGTSNASKLLQKYGAELSATINADPAVQQARATLDEAIGNEKGVEEAQEILTTAQRSAYDRFENSEAGKAILAEIAGLKKAIEKYDGMISGSTQSDTVTAALEAIK
tara:strand:- start:3673 stop:5193 length:1521 start_codon:yes stop_codon:yes gene_type:complete